MCDYVDDIIYSITITTAIFLTYYDFNLKKRLLKYENFNKNDIRTMLLKVIFYASYPSIINIPRRFMKELIQFFVSPNGPWQQDKIYYDFFI